MRSYRARAKPDEVRCSGATRWVRLVEHRYGRKGADGYVWSPFSGWDNSSGCEDQMRSEQLKDPCFHASWLKNGLPNLEIIFFLNPAKKQRKKERKKKRQHLELFNLWMTSLFQPYITMWLCPTSFFFPTEKGIFLVKKFSDIIV